MKRMITCCFILGLLVSLLITSCAPAATPQAAPSPKATQTQPAAPSPKATQTQPAAPSPKATQTQPAAQMPKSLSIGTTASGSIYYAVGVGLSTVLKKHTTSAVNVAATAGPSAWFPLMKKGEVELGIANTMDVYQAYRGLGEYEKLGAYQARALKVGHALTAGIIVRKDSPIKSIVELKGKKVSLFPTGHAGTAIGTRAELANWGLTPEDVIEVPNTSINEGSKNLIEGKVVATCCSLGSALLKETDSAIGIRYLPQDPAPEAIKRMKAVAPAMYLLKVEPQLGVLEPMYLQAMDASLLSYVDIPDEVAYTIVKVLWDNYNELKPISPTLSAWTQQRSVSEDITYPYHPGAIKFYKEVGAWTAKMDEVQKRLIAEFKPK